MYPLMHFCIRALWCRWVWLRNAQKLERVRNAVHFRLNSINFQCQSKKKKHVKSVTSPPHTWCAMYDVHICIYIIRFTAWVIGTESGRSLLLPSSLPPHYTPLRVLSSVSFNQFDYTPIFHSFHVRYAVDIFFFLYFFIIRSCLGWTTVAEMCSTLTVQSARLFTYEKEKYSEPKR